MDNSTTADPSSSTTNILSTSASATAGGTTVAASTGEASTTAAETTGTSTGSTGWATGATTGETGVPVCPGGPGNVFGARAFNSPGNQYTVALALDGAGRLTALFRTTWVCGDPQIVDFGGSPLQLTSNSYVDPVLARYDPALGQIWQHHFAAPNHQEPIDVTLDAQGRIYMLATFVEGISLPSKLGQPGTAKQYVPSGPVATVVAVFDPEGNYLASDMLAGTNIVRGASLAVTDGRFAIGGNYAGSLAFEGETHCPFVDLEKSPFQAFVISYASNFQREWTRCTVGLGADNRFADASSIAFAPDGSLVASGTFGGEIAFDPLDVPGTLAVGEATKGDVFVAAWTAAGDHAWHLECGTTQQDSGRGLVVGKDGRIIVAGSLGEGMKCSEYTGKPAVSVFQRGFVAAFYPPSPNPQWIFDRTLSGEGTLTNVVEDECGDIVVVGTSPSGVLWEPDLPVDDDGVGGDVEDIVVARLNSQGDPVWGRVFGSALADAAYGLALAPAGDAFVGGYYKGEAAVAEGTQWPPADACGMNDLEEAFLLHVSP